MQDWLVGIVGEDIAPIASIVLTALFVIVLALIVIGLLRRLMSGGMGIGGSQGPRVAVVDVTAVDQKRKLVLVRRDQVEHLILIGGQNDLLIESGIGRAPPAARWAEPAPGQPMARPQQPGEQRRPSVPQGALARVEPAAPRAPNVRPVVEPPVVARAPVPEARREAPAMEPVFVAPLIDTPTPQDRIDEAPRNDSPAAPAVEPQRPMVTPRAAMDVAPDSRTEQPVVAPVPGLQRTSPVEPVGIPASTAPRPVPSPAAVVAAPAPRPQTALPPQSRPMATPVAPLKRATPVLAPETMRAAESPERAPTTDGTVATAPATAVRIEPSRVTSFGERRVDPPLTAPDAGERQPLSVRSFASTIQERPSAPPPAAPAIPARQAAPFVAAPIVAESAEMSPSQEDELANMLSAELDGSDRMLQTSPSQAPLDAPAQPEPASGAGQNASQRELSLEEEMERLLRDFSLQTADRR